MKRMAAIMLSLTVMLFLIGCGEESTYDKDKYFLFQRTRTLLYSLTSDELGEDYIISMNDSEGIWEQGVIKARIRWDEQWDKQGHPDYTTTYAISIDGETVLEYTREEPATPLRHLYYADINQDGYKDLIFVSETPGGTMSGPCRVFIYDLYNDCEVQFLNQEWSSLTNKLLDEVETLVDDEFYEIFPGAELDCCTQGGELFVDYAGNMYYLTVVGKMVIPPYYMEGLGEMILFLSYDAEKDDFYVEDVLYMPYEQS